MVKRIAVIGLALLGAWSCAAVPTAPPVFFVERRPAGGAPMPPSRVGLAQIYESRREREKAFNEYREILKREPAHRWAAPRFESLRNDLVKEATAAARDALASGNQAAAKREFAQELV